MKNVNSNVNPTKGEIKLALDPNVVEAGVVEGITVRVETTVTVLVIYTVEFMVLIITHDGEGVISVFILVYVKLSSLGTNTVFIAPNFFTGSREALLGRKLIEISEEFKTTEISFTPL